MAGNLTAQVRNIAQVTTAVANGDLSPQDHGGRAGRNSGAEEHHQHHGGPAQLASPREVTRVAREVGTEGKLGGQAEVRGVAGTWKDLDRQRQLHGRQPHHPGPRYRQSGDRRGQRQPEAQTGARNQGRNRRTGRHHQRHDRHAGGVRRPGEQRGARSRHRRQARRPGARARRGRHLARSYRQRQPAGRQPHHPGARHRRRGDRRDQGRPDAIHRGGSAGRSGRAEGQHQRDDRQPGGDHAQEHRPGLAEDQHRQVHRHDAGPARPVDRVASCCFPN